ncbi:hypothetical protein LX64_02835 [Chitinophaga skermanii]|uniref:Uncharacterized protein n=1 Tax=Chitinophaga skermanii TaxID=331697 RepID=A0A327QJ03_9BACT|nr:hypothetical protein [Chitinophaga skermanii]RAJ03958.1 hypothetical protein LX64_02835 [Chitinophaga skermanii]
MNQQHHLQQLSDIKQMMERSTRFLSLSGLSGIASGITGLIGAFIARSWMKSYYSDYDAVGRVDAAAFLELKVKLIVLAICTLVVAVGVGAIFTYRRPEVNKQTFFSPIFKKITINLMIPLVTGGIFIAALITHDRNFEVLVAPTCLVFYGLALLNISKYMVSDIKYLALVEILLGLLNMFFLRNGIYFWMIGFGFMHIIYGASMWWKYERKGSVN